MRNPSIDIAKGITILLVIIGHQSNLPELVRQLIYSFHMPLFFILSGIFFKVKDMRKHVSGDAKRLLLPYIITCGIFLVWWMMRLWHCGTPMEITWKVKAVLYGSGTIHDSPLYGGVSRLGAIWFLLAMFWCRLAYRCIVGSCNSQYASILGGGAAISASLIDVYIINLPLSILPGLSAIMFFMIGNMFMVYRERLLKYKKLILIIGFICFILEVRYSHLTMAKCSYGCYPIDIMAGCFGTYIMYLISTQLNTTIMRRIFIWLGMNSMTILCLHFLELHSGVWEVLHINCPWYYMLPIKFVSICIGTLLLYYIPLTRKIYRIKLMK